MGTEFEILYKGLMASNSVNTINLSNNRLDDNTGSMIGKLISAHSEKRDQYIWVYSIRGEQPPEDIELKGIFSLTSNMPQRTCSKRDL